MWAKRWFCLHSDGMLTNTKQQPPFYTVGATDAESQKAVDERNFFGPREDRASSTMSMASLMGRDRSSTGVSLGVVSEIFSSMNEGHDGSKRIDLKSCDIVNEIGERGGKYVVRVNCQTTNRTYWFGSNSRQEMQEWLFDIMDVRNELSGTDARWKQMMGNAERLPPGSADMRETLKRLPRTDWFKEWREAHGAQPYPGLKLVPLPEAPGYLRLRRRYRLRSRFHLYAAAV
eukprot:CAMPEP_0194559902 /NCGR_PEP_ID=MMETSP0292-20121207/1283_1 /TAXON_ID=39354 /ORGANISM="Heterosigma akashiwo, Strain CCMP2393" /LENGTH=230 /DNA_ID=CAMNT_0039407947 /DNA_START=274 /DNA_END=963 /DNA_ORIENTATION=-